MKTHLFVSTFSGTISRAALMRRAVALAAVGVGSALTIGWTGTITNPGAQAKERSERLVCTTATLQGTYGRLVSGTRPAPAAPGQIETFVGTGMREYDGRGGFVETSSSHGSLTPAIEGTHGTGTYQVNADCTGVAIIVTDGAPFPIETAFVIVAGGREVKHAVMSPQPQVVTAVETHIGR
jgi:hypothetical protein